ncbi:MAG: leucine-rich repeat domain-containing protein [Clostridia bacterium]|nr:leucine-rich repeat domain-containing protein [Clostridia bacterium]
MKKRLLLLALTIVCSVCLCLGLTACDALSGILGGDSDSTSTSTSSSSEDNTVKELEYTLSTDGASYTVSSIGTCADSDIVIPDTYNGLPVTAIAESAFKVKMQVESIVIGNNVTSIGSGAFYNCHKLISVTIGSSVTSIGSSAFYGCEKLIEVCNLSSLSITAGSEDNGYVADHALYVYTASGSSNLFTQGDYQFFKYTSKGNTTYYLVRYTGSSTAITLPSLTVDGSSVDYEIYTNAFYNGDIVSAYLPECVIGIAKGSFNNCFDLTSVTVAVTTGWYWGTSRYTLSTEETSDVASPSVLAESLAAGGGGYYRVVD